MIPLLLGSIPGELVKPVQAAPVVLISQDNTAQSPASTVINEDPLPNQYPYGSIQAGIGFPNNLSGNLNILALPTTLRNTLTLDPGFNGELALGYKFPQFRTDLSVGYSSFASRTQTITVPGFGSASISGTGAVNLLTVMANAYYDFKIKNNDGSRSRWSPYIGAGIGWGNLSAPGCAQAGCTLFDAGTSSTFAYQGKVGVSYRATNSGFAFLEGGYLGTTGATIQNNQYDSFGAWRINLGWRQKI